MTESPAHEPGWYLDPHGSGNIRHWDGRRWGRDVVSCSPVTMAAIAAREAPPAPIEPTAEELAAAPAAKRRDPVTLGAIVASVVVVLAVVLVVVTRSGGSHPSASVAAGTALNLRPADSTQATPSTVPATQPPVTPAPSHAAPSHAAPSHTAPASAGSPASVPPSAADQAIADHSLLQLGDLPTGWVDQPASSGSSSSNDSNPPACDAVSTPNDPSAAGSSADFQAPAGAATVENDVTVWATSALAAADQRLMLDPQAADCLVAIFANPSSLGLDANQTAGTPSVSSSAIPGLPVPVDMVDVIIPISTAGRAAVPIHMTIIDVIVGRVESQIDVIWGGIALPASFTGPLIAAAIAHMGGGGTALPTV